jgi:GNAT superfamily N-acetyltransferase
VTELRFSLHDRCPPEAAAAVDAGLGAYNDDAAPLHEVQPIACVVHDGAGNVVGGAVGRWWGACCELQQLWLRADLRRQGVGADLVRRFEAFARGKGCRSFYLETWSFQAPAFYRALGYEVELARRGYPHGIVKYHLVKQVDGGSGT